MHTLWFSLTFKDVVQHEDIIENLENSEFLMATEKMSSNKVFLLVEIMDTTEDFYHTVLLPNSLYMLKRIHLLDTVLLLKMEMPYYPL